MKEYCLCQNTLGDIFPPTDGPIRLSSRKWKSTVCVKTLWAISFLLQTDQSDCQAENERILSVSKHFGNICNEEVRRGVQTTVSTSRFVTKSLPPFGEWNNTLKLNNTPQDASPDVGLAFRRMKQHFEIKQHSPQDASPDVVLAKCCPLFLSRIVFLNPSDIWVNLKNSLPWEFNLLYSLLFFFSFDMQMRSTSIHLRFYKIHWSNKLSQ